MPEPTVSERADALLTRLEDSVAANKYRDPGRTPASMASVVELAGIVRDIAALAKERGL